MKIRMLSVLFFSMFSFPASRSPGFSALLHISCSIEHVAILCLLLGEIPHLRFSELMLIFYAIVIFSSLSTIKMLIKMLLRMLLLQLSLSTSCSFSSYMSVNCQLPGKDLGFHSPQKGYSREFA